MRSDFFVKKQPFTKYVNCGNFNEVLVRHDIKILTIQCVYQKYSVHILRLDRQANFTGKTTRYIVLYNGTVAS